MHRKIGMAAAAAIVLALATAGFAGVTPAQAQAPAAEEDLLILPPWGDEFRPWLVQSIIAAAAHAIGIEVEEVKMGLRHGASLKEIAARHGVGPVDLAQGILRYERHYLHRLIEAGEITPRAAARVMHFLTEHIRLIINYHIPGAPCTKRGESADYAALSLCSPGVN
jgi:hypothetical protein